MGSFQASIVVEEVATDKLEITQHPIQKGAAISDHAYKKPAQVVIKSVSSEADLGKPLDELYNQLLELQALRMPFDVITGKRNYKNMLFETLSNTTDAKNEHVLTITATLQEVIIVSISSTTIAPRSSQKSPGKTGGTENAGNKKTEPQLKKESALSRLGGFF